MASNAARGVVGGMTKIKAKDTTAPFIALLIFVAGGFYAMRAQQKSKLTGVPATPEAMPPGLRYRVDMAHRVDQDRLREWLAEQDAAAKTAAAAAEPAGGEATAAAAQATGTVAPPPPGAAAPLQ